MPDETHDDFRDGSDWGPEEFVWGVDPGTKLVAFAFASVDQARCAAASLSIPPKDHGSRLGIMHKLVRSFAREMAKDFPPAAVIVEQPSGKFVKPQLSYVAGVVQAAIYEATGAPVWTLPPSSWKKRTVGAGNASKADVQAWLHKASIGSVFSNEHEADALAIALAGHQMFCETERRAA